MQRLRRLFLLPSAAVMIMLFFVPLLIVLFYSFLTRGAYGGVALPFSSESYRRVFDPLYLAIALAVLLDRRSVSHCLPVSGLSVGALYCAVTAVTKRCFSIL